MKKHLLSIISLSTTFILLSITGVRCTSPVNSAEATDNELKVTPNESTLDAASFFVKSVKASVKGTSTLHAWKSEVTGIECNGSFESLNNILETIKDVEVKIPVKGIKSTEGKKMDSKTYETFKSDKNPFITYSFSRADVKTDAKRMVTIESYGNLVMEGISKPIVLNATGKVLQNGDLQLAVSQKIKMTDYKMKPPVMMLGTIKVGDEITVNFDFVLAKRNKN